MPAGLESLCKSEKGHSRRYGEAFGGSQVVSVGRKKLACQFSITETIAKARNDAGPSQRKLSAHLCEVNNYIQRIESGQRDVTVIEFFQIANAIGVDPCDLRRAVFL